MKKLGFLLIGLFLGIVITVISIKHYAPIKTDVCYTDGVYQIKVSTEIKFPGEDKFYPLVGQEFYMLSTNKWKPCNK